jgi:hypothetical protein
MLRNVQVGAYTYPMKPEFSNWRDEQAAWKNTAVLFDQSFHMTDVYFRGPDVLRLLSDLGVNTFKNFGRNNIGEFVIAGCRPHKRKVWLLWNDEDVTRAIASSLFDGPRHVQTTLRATLSTRPPV